MASTESEIQEEEIKSDIQVELIETKSDNVDSKENEPQYTKASSGTKSRRLSQLKGIASSQVLLLDEQNKMLENMNLGCCPSGHNLTKIKAKTESGFQRYLIDYVCDYCWNVIDDVRYQCRMCDFDFCAKCYLKIRLGNKSINYLKIAKWLNDITPIKKKQYWKKITVKVKKSNPEQWEKLLAHVMETKREKKRRQKEVKQRQMQQLLSPGTGLAEINESTEIDDDTENKEAIISPQLSDGVSSRKHSIASSSRIGDAIYSKIPFIQSLDNEDEIQKFLAHFIVSFLQNTSSKAHQARVDVDSVMSFVKDDAVFLMKNLRDKKKGLNYGFFISKHFTKLLTKLHYNKATLSEFMLSPFGYKMKWCSTNPSIVSRHSLSCNICQRKLDLTSFFSPNEFAFDYKTKTCLCPAHATSAGAAAQSPRFVSEVFVFLDVIRVYQRLKSQDHSELADIWDNATRIDGKEENLGKSIQFVELCVALGNKAKEMNIEDEKQNVKETMDNALASLKKHAEQCANWIFTNKTRKKDVNKLSFLESNVFIEILLDYYWEFSEYSNTGGRLQDQEYDLYKYVNFWLKERVSMTPKELYHRVVDDGDSKYLKKLVAFLYGQQECEANLISDKNVILEHLQIYLEQGIESFQDTLSSIKVQALAGIQQSSDILANMKYLDDRIENIYLKKDVIDYDATKDPLSFDQRNESLDINWLEIAGFIRNVGSEYMQLLIKQKFEEAISLYNIDLRNKQRAFFAPKFKLRIILYHFINKYHQVNNPNAPRLITPSMFVHTNSVELLLDYMTNEYGWACSNQRAEKWKEQNKLTHGDHFQLDKDEDLGIYKELLHKNTIELSVWSLIYETSLSDVLVNYHYSRKYLECKEQKEHAPGHVVDLPLNALRLSHFHVDASRSHRRNRNINRTAQENEGGAHYRVNFIRMDENDALNVDDLKLSFHYRLIRRSERVRGWDSSCVGPNGEFIVRFRVSAFTSSIYIRLASAPHSFLYEIEIKPTITPYAQYISYCAITMEEHRKKEEFKRIWLQYNNHHGVWFTLHCSKTRFFLLADYIDNLSASRVKIEDFGNCSRLITMKRIKANNHINWIGFASLNDNLTVSTPDTDQCIMESWVKWLKATGLHKYSEAYSDVGTHYPDDEEDAEDYKEQSESTFKPEQLSKQNLKKMLKHTHSTFLIDMIDNTAFHRIKKSASHDWNVNTILNATSPDTENEENEDSIFALLSRIFKHFHPSFRLVPSLSPGCEFAVEIKFIRPLLTSVIRETFETDAEITQTLGDGFIIIHQIVYDKLQIDSDVWLFLSQHVADICDLEEMDQFTATSNKVVHAPSELLKSFLLYAFRPTMSKEQMETFITTMTQETNTWKHQRSMTARGYTRYDDNPAIEMRDINNGESKVVRIYDYNTINMLTFSFSTIMKINCQLFTKLMEIRDSLPFTINEKNKNLIEHELSNYNVIIQRLKRNPIWPYIEVKRSRAGTLERLTANKVEYVWRGGTTALLSDSALPIQMSMLSDKGGNDGEASYERLLYYEVELEKVGVDKSINVGATLGKHFSYFTSSSQPGQRPCSWGLSGDLGLLYDENKQKTNYGPSFQNGLIVGCGFVLTTPEQFDPDDLDADKYTSNLFFTYDGMALKYYPNQDANESLLPRNVLHKLFAVTSTGSEGCKLKFNFGPRFTYDNANQMIYNYFNLAEKNYVEEFQSGIRKQLDELELDLDKPLGRKDNQEEKEEKEEPKNKQELKVTVTDIDVLSGTVGDTVVKDELKQDLLTELEEEILTELVLQFETEDKTDHKSNKNTLIDDEEIPEDAYMKLKYEALYNKVIMSYYFYLTPFEQLDSVAMYELLVQFHLLNLATIVSDVGVNGFELIHLEDTIKEWILSDDVNDEKYRVALWLLNTNSKHTELLKEFRNAMKELSDSLYNENIVPVHIKQMNSMSLNNIPRAIRELALNKNDAHSQIYLLKLWRLIAHQRRLNPKGSGKGDMTSLKQEFLLDFIAYFLSNGNTIELITQLLISWSGGNFNVERESANFSGQYELSILLSGFIRGSNNPISAAVQVGQFLEENRRSFPEIEGNIIEISDDVQRMAVDILGDIHSNRLAIIAMEANSSLDIALDYGLQEFISSDRVQYLKQLMWTRSGDELLTSTNSEHFRYRSNEIATWFHVIFAEYIGLFKRFFTQMFKLNTRKYLYDFFLTKRNQMSWFFSPVGKMQIEFFVYILYLLLLVYVANDTTSWGVYQNTLSVQETAFWICNISFVFAEVREVLSGKKSYWSDHKNYIDIWINVLYILLGLIRFFGFTEIITHCGPNKEEREKCLDKPLNIINIVLWFLLIMSVCGRTSYMLFVFYNMGLLVRALFKMLKDVINFVLLIVIILFGFALSIHLGTNGEATSFESVGTSMRALFYAMLGEIDYAQLIEDTECQTEAAFLGISWKEHECLNNFGEVRSVVNSALLFLWMLTAAILLINFIIAVMNNTYELVQNEVGRFVKFNRMRVCRYNDRKLPTIPAPFQIIIVVMKVIWFYLMEPLIFVFCGKFINEEKLICSFNHMKYFYKEEFYNKKVRATWLRKPFFIEYNDHIHGTPPKPPRNICQRLKFVVKAAKEAQSGLLYVDEDHKTEQNDPSIWICGYCRCTNYEFEREKRRATSYSDIIRYYKYNDLLPPEFGFNDVDIQFLEHITPPLCDNCFRLRFWVQRNVVIESLIAFYLYFVLSSFFIKLPLFLILFSISLIVALIGIIISLFYGLYLLISRCCGRIKRCCCRCCCYKAQDIDYHFKEQMERHRPLNKQKIITSLNVASALDASLYIEGKRFSGMDHFNVNVRELPVIQDAEDRLALKRRAIAANDAGKGDADDDSDDDTNSYKTLSGDNKYDLVLVVLNTDFSVEQTDNFIQLLHGADGLLNISENRNENNLARKYHHRFRSIFYPKNVEDIVKREIIAEGNQRIVLAHDQYRKCIKFKKNVSKLMEDMMIEKSKTNKNNKKYILPPFEIKVMPQRHSLSYNFGQKQTLKASYQLKQSILATQQTRTRYQFQYNPVMKRIHQYK